MMIVKLLDVRFVSCPPDLRTLDNLGGFCDGMDPVSEIRIDVATPRMFTHALPHRGDGLPLGRSSRPARGIGSSPVDSPGPGVPLPVGPPGRRRRPAFQPPARRRIPLRSSHRRHLAPSLSGPWLGGAPGRSAVRPTAELSPPRNGSM